MELDTKGLPRLLTDQAIAAQAAAGRTLNFGRGSLLRAMAEGFAAVALWFQAQLLRVLSATRLATSRRDDAITFVADFGLTPIAATFARGSVTLSRFRAGVVGFAPVGGLVRTGDATATFRVVAGGAGFDAASNGYPIAIATTAITVPVEALTPGPPSNVDPGTVTLLASAMPGIDAVTNAAAFAGGAAEEATDALKARFPRYIASLSEATRDAVNRAISEVQPGIRWKVLPLEDAAGAPKSAHFTIVADDGTGAPSQEFLNRVGAAVERTRGLGITSSAIAATLVPVSISFSVTTAPNTDHAGAVGRAALAVGAYRDALDIGAPLDVFRLGKVALDADPAITKVSNVTLNGGVADVVPTARQRLSGGVVTVA